jgi:hypothetical protein
MLASAPLFLPEADTMSRPDLRLPRYSTSDVLYVGALVFFAWATASVWWLSTIVPGMDYPQFLVFVRAVLDCGNPASPFHGTYSVGPWFMPTSLPVELTAALSRILGGSVEAAGRLLLGAHDVGLILASAYLLKLLGRPRWAVVLVIPLVHSRWALVGGYFVFSTCIPLVVLGWALTVRWLQRLDAASGVAMGICLCATLLWHGIGFTVLGMGVAVLWSLWRAPSVRARALSVAPCLPALLLAAMWWTTTFVGGPAQGSGSTWRAPAEAIEAVPEYTWASVPHATAWAWTLAAIVVAGLVASKAQVGATVGLSAMWRVGNPFLVLVIAYFLAYIALPLNGNKVEGISTRFAYPALLAFVFAWSLPRPPFARGVVLTAILGFSVAQLADLRDRFRAFHEDTKGASALMDRLGPHETLYYFPTDRGVARDFAPGHVPLRELQQYATARHGGLPNSSFAGYGINYVSYVGGRNPMPGITGPPRKMPGMQSFDYVLVRTGQAPQEPSFTRVAAEAGWELYGVCGSHRFPDCAGAVGS